MPQLKGPVPQVQAKEGPMPQLVKKRRSGWALLAVSALIASLFAVGAAPAAALDEDSEPDHLAPTIACVGGATDDMMFSDVSEMHTFRDDINCLAHYGITIGYGDGTFQPNVDVPRYQMVLFMERTAALVGADVDDVLGDFPTAGDGGDSVTRADMATLIANLLIATPDNDIERNDDGVIEINDVDSSNFDFFADARAEVPRGVDEAISALYELGVVKGTGGGDYSPGGTVDRGAMAAFITRALAHTNARPVGLSAQVNTDGSGTITVSVRDANHAPVVNQAVDLFYVSTSNKDRVLKDDGTCSSRARDAGGGKPCEIDGGDPVTLTDGNVSVTAPDPGEAGVSVWVWMGDVGDKFDSDTTAHALEIPASERVVPVATSTAADNLEVTRDLAMGASRAKFGDTVTVTVQLQITVDGEDVDARRGDDPLSYEVTVEVRTGTDPASGDAFERDTSQVMIGPDGSGSFTITTTDPDPTTGNTNSDPVGDPNNRVVSYTISDGTVSSTGNVVFTDERSAVRTVSVDVGAPRVAPGMGSTAGAAATVTLLDQYGDPVSGQLVQLRSDIASTPDRARITGRTGQVRIGYSYTGTADQETLTAWWNGARNLALDSPVACPAPTDTDPQPSVTTAASGDDPEEIALCRSATVFWVGTVLHANTGTDGGATNTGIPGLADLADTVTLLSIDTENKMLVVNTGTGGDVVPNLISYDDNDFFTVGTEPTSMAGFEKAAQEAVDEDPQGTAPVLAWQDYRFDDPTESAWFTLTPNLTS